MSREAMQMALEALESDPVSHLGLVHRKLAITALRQALDVNMSEERVDEIVKDEHEPVAWANSFDLQNFDMKVRTGPDLHHTVPLYTAPPKQWVGLTDEEIEDEWESITGHSIFGGDKAEGRTMYLSPNEVLEFARAIEAKLKEKNGG